MTDKSKSDIIEGEFSELDPNSPSEIVEIEQTSDDLAVMPVMNMAVAKERYQQMRQFVSDLMVEDKDFGTIPGTSKPTLYKPGAEKLLTFFGLSKVFRLIDSVEQWEPTLEQGRDPEYTPVFYYRYRCTVTRKGAVIADGEGSCSSLEDRYRWRWVEEQYIPDGVDKEKLRTRDGTVSEFEFAYEKRQTAGEWGKSEEYWQKFDAALDNKTARRIKRTTRGGKILDALEIGSSLYRIPNPDVHSLVNTIQKMAQKRAMIGATLPAVNASEFFTQDVEDMPPQALSGIDSPPAAPEQQEQGANEEKAKTTIPDREASQKASGKRAVLPPEKVKETIWKIIEESKSVPPMEEDHKRGIIELLDYQLSALEPELLEGTGEAAEGVFFYLTDTRDTETVPDIVWNSIWRWLDVKFNDDGMEIGSEAARQEIGAIWRESLEESGTG